MAANKECCVRDCPARHAKNQTFFGLPVGKEQQLQWLTLIGRLDLYQDQNAERNYFVCSCHFEESQLSIKKQALPHAIPTRNVPTKREGEVQCAPNTREGEVQCAPNTREGDDCVIVSNKVKPISCGIDCYDIIPLDDLGNGEPFHLFNHSKYFPRDCIASANRKIFVFSEDLNAKRNKLSVPAIEVAKASNSDIRESPVPLISNVTSLKLNGTFKEFCIWRQRTTDRRKEPKYERDFKMFALNLHTINTAAYRLLIDSWQLPKENELKGIHLKVRPELGEPMTRLLRQKFKSLSEKAKFCTLGLYAMPLKPHFYYDPANDEVIGFQNVSGEKSRIAANYALIAMVRGIVVPWSLPVAFSFFSTMTDVYIVEYIDAFVTNVVTKLTDMDVKILGVVMSDDCFFWEYCKTKHSVSVNDNNIKIGNETLLVVFDFPHILNTFKDKFIENDFSFDGKNVSWKYLKQVYDIDKARGVQLLSELTDEHMKVDDEEKGIKHPCQVFSQAVCGAIDFYKELGLIEADSDPTADFIKDLNAIFSVFNIKVLKDQKSDSKKLQAEEQSEAYRKGFALFKKLFNATNLDANHADVSTLMQFLISFKSLWCISSYLKDNGQSGIEQTRLCYLEPMLELLKEIKSEAESNRPSPIQFTKSFSKLFAKNLIDLAPAPKSIGKMDDFLKMADSVKDCCETHKNRIRLKNSDYKFTVPDENAIVYFSSFLLFKCWKSHRCKEFADFMKNLVDLNTTEVYTHFEKLNKDASFYNRLKLSPIEFTAYVERLDNSFMTSFNVFFYTHPAQTILITLKKMKPWSPPCSCFPTEYMLKLFVRTRIYQTVLYNTKCLKSKKTTFLEAKKL